MAFSYSDEYFTVIGNLCFVHINMIDPHKKCYEMPPAIGNRMLIDKLTCVYPYYTEGTDSKGTDYEHANIGIAYIDDEEVYCYSTGKGYVFCCFPIDSNK